MPKIDPPTGFVAPAGLVATPRTVPSASSGTTGPVSPARATSIGSTAPELTGSDFILLEEPKAQTVGILFAKDGHGKTWFTVNSCPEPVVLIGLDRRGERAAKEAMKRGRKVYYLDAAMPANALQMSHEQAQEHGKNALDLITRNYEWAIGKSIREWGRGTLVFDTSTELRDIARVAVRGRIDRPNPKSGEKGDFGKSDALINQTLKYFCDRARDSNLNLVLLSRAKPVYEGREDTGRITWDTDKIFSQAADWIVEYRMVGQMVGGGGPIQLLGAMPAMSAGPSFEMQVTQPKLNIEEMGKVYRQHEWGAEGPFSYLCTRVVPGSQTEDWR